MYKRGDSAMNVLMKLREFRGIRAINEECKSVYFLAFFALLILLSALFGLELICYTIAWLIGVYLLLFSDDLFPLAGVIPLLYFSPSVKNNPGQNPDSIFYPENGLIYIVVLMATFVALFIIRAVVEIRSGRLKPHFPKLTIGFVLLGISYAIGGIGYPDYDDRTIFFGLVQILSLCLLYFLFFLFVDWSGAPDDYFAWILFFGGVIISVQLLSVYAFSEVFADGAVQRTFIYMGWGMYNNVGCMLDMMIPGALYLAVKKRNGWLFLLIAVAFYAAVILTFSRTSIAVGTVVLLFGWIAVFIKKKGPERWVCRAIVLLSLAAAVLFVATHKDVCLSFVKDLLNFEEDASGELRIDTYRNGIELFKKYPVFGTGFYSCANYRWGSGTDSFIPARWHNTYVQLLASCGVFGAIAYLLHRVQTFYILFRRPSFEKTMIGLSVFALIAASWLDCHFFNIGPALLYSVLLCCAEKLMNRQEVAHRKALAEREAQESAILTENEKIL